MTRLLLLAALAATPLAAQAPPNRAPATPPPGARQIKIDVSPAGQLVLKKYLGTPNPAIAPHVAQLRSVTQQIGALADAPALDLARLQALMRQQEQAELAIKRANNDRSLAMLRELSPPDRLAFLRSFRAAQAAAQQPAR